MSNNYNITISNFGTDDGKTFLYDPIVYIKEFGALDSTLQALGVCAMEKTYKQKLEYAVLETGIPATELRRDIIRQTIELEGKTKQFQPETIALISQRSIATSTGTYDGKTYKRVTVGSSIPAPSFFSVIIAGQTVDGKLLKYFIRKAQFSSEDFEAAMGGESHSEISFTIRCLKDDAPATNNSEWPYSGTEQDNISFWMFED